MHQVLSQIFLLTVFPSPQSENKRILISQGRGVRKCFDSVSQKRQGVQKWSNFARRVFEKLYFDKVKAIFMK